MRSTRGKLHVFLALTLWVTTVGFSAEPTHELTQKFEASISGETVVLEAGAKVEVVQWLEPTAFVKHSLSGGGATILQIPTAQLQKIPAAAHAATLTLTPKTEGIALAQTTAPDSPTDKTRIKLTATDGKVFEGKIIRVEKTVVVLHQAEDEVLDIALKSLDEPSKGLVADHASQLKGKPAIPDPRVIPGKKIFLSFPELGASNQSDPAKIQIRIPENYKADQPVPLILFMAGGEGSENCDGASAFVDPQNYILVAFPYSKKYPSPMKACIAGQTDELIAFQKPMLERLKLLVPNSDPLNRVVVGTSNGAHSIAVASCDGWDEFTDFFSAYVMHEGGGSKSGNFKALKRKDVYVMMGADSTNRAFAEGIAKAVEKSNPRVETYATPGEGHGIGDKSREAAKAWIEKTRLAQK